MGPGATPLLGCPWTELLAKRLDAVHGGSFGLRTVVEVGGIVSLFGGGVNNCGARLKVWQGGSNDTEGSIKVGLHGPVKEFRGHVEDRLHLMVAPNVRDKDIQRAEF